MTDCPPLTDAELAMVTRGVLITGELPNRQMLARILNQLGHAMAQLDREKTRLALCQYLLTNAQASMATVISEHKAHQDLLRDLATNWDCDGGHSSHNPNCRVCTARAALGMGLHDFCSQCGEAYPHNDFHHCQVHDGPA